MKKRFFLLIPLTILLVFGLFMVPAKGQGLINDAQNDVFGVHTYLDGGPQIDCSWTHELNTSLDIKSIFWHEFNDGVDKYNVSMEFYGTLNETYITNETVVVNIFFLVNGTDFPSDLEFDFANGELPDYHLIVSSLGTGIANGTGIPETGVMTFSGNNITWTFNQTVVATAPLEVLENWNVTAMVVYASDNGTDTYLALDHIGLDYMMDNMLALCGILEIDIPGYPLIAVGVISVITVGMIIRKKMKK